MTRQGPKIVVRVALACSAVALACVLAVPDERPLSKLTADEVARMNSFVERFRLGQRLFGSGRDDVAEEIFEDLLAEQPEAAELHHALGLLYLHTGRRPQAVASLSRAAELTTDEPVILRDAAEQLVAVGRLVDAERLFARARELWADEVDTVVGHGTVLRALGRKAEAIAAFRHAVRVQPESVDARVGLGACLVEQAPREALEAVTGLPSTFADVALVHGLALERLERFEEAAPYLVQAARAAPIGSLRVQFTQQATEALIRCGAVAQAREAAALWCAADGSPSGPQPSFALALALAAGGQAAEALAVLDAAREKPQPPAAGRRQIALFRSALLVEEGRQEEATKLLTSLAGESEPSFECAAARRLLGREQEDWRESFRDSPGLRNDVEWVESLLARSAGREGEAQKRAGRARELSSPPGEYPGLLLVPAPARQDSGD